MSVCELRRATLYDTDAVYALICELKQGQFDLQALALVTPLICKIPICTTSWH